MADNYVAPGPNGSYIAVVNGRQVGGSGMTQTQAEQAYNANQGVAGFGASAPAPSAGAAPPPAGGQTYQTPNGPKTLQEIITGLQGAGWNGNYGDTASVIAAYNQTASGGGGGGALPGAAGGSSQKLLDAIASGDREKFDEAIREFNVTAGQSDRSQYSQLAQSLLSTASQLRGPKDYYQFQQYTSGGKDLMSQLYGNQARPDFSAPTGPIQPMTVGDLMTKMGFAGAPGATGTAGATGAAGTYTTINGPKTVQQMHDELDVAAGGKWGGDTSEAGIAAAYASTTKGPVTPAGGAAPAGTAAPTGVAGTYTTNNGPKTVDQMYQELKVAGWGGAPTDTAGILATYASTAKTPVTPVAAAAPAAVPTTTPLSGVQTATAPQPSLSSFDPTKPVPLPYQINPAVWDSLGPTGQALTLSIAGGQGWDPDEYTRQLNLARPVGAAPQATTTAYSAPSSAYGGT